MVTLHTYEPGEHLEEHLEAFGFGEPDQPAKSALRLPSDGFRGVCGGREREQCEAVANGDGGKWRLRSSDPIASIVENPGTRHRRIV